jgi:hypothetical protein
MDFIERWFHVSPDGGNGVLELTYLLAALAASTALTFRRRLRHRWASRSRNQSAGEED